MGRQWESDIRTEPDVVRAVIEAQFPHLAPVQLEQMAEGWDNTLYLVNRRFVFRLPRRAVAVPLIARETAALPQLATRLPIAIPTPLFLGQPSELFPLPFMGYERIAGQPPHETALTDAQRTASAVLWGRFLRRLHDIPAAEAVRWGIPPEDELGRLDVAKRAPAMLDRACRLAGSGLLKDVDAVRAIADAAQQAQDAARRVPPAVVHGDLNFRNFLVDEDGLLCGVIDWGDVHVGHPAVDLTVVYSFLPVPARELFWRVYGPVPREVRVLARFRALYAALLILEYAQDIGDERQVREAMRCVGLCLDSEAGCAG
jgi:aminoglycoside phosphotransferase (APT) family kinase protein